MARYATCVAGMALVFAGCGETKKSGDAAAGAPGRTGAGEQAAKKSPDAPPRRAALTARSLSPVVIHEVGPENAVATTVVIQFAAPIVDRDAIGTPSTAGLQITPKIEGALVHSGTSELTFTPARPFDFETAYQIELTGVDSLDGVIARGDEAWRYAFKTPSFRFLGWSPSDIDLAHHKITMDIAFSGPVLPNLARAALSVTIDGRAPAGIAMPPSGATHRVSVTLSDPKLAAGSKLSLAIQRTLTSLTGVRASAAAAEYVVASEKVVSIKTAAIVEGASGFYLEVVCDDAAAPEGKRAYYDEVGYYNLSQRCQLTDESLRHIHFEPAVKRTYITAGRAGFRVFGDFQRGVYKVKIDSGAASVDGGVVVAPFTQTFSVSARRPQLGFVATGRYLPRSAWTNLGVRHTNIDSVNLVVRQVPAENLVYWLGDASDAATERTSDVILKKTFPLRGAPDAPATTWLDVAQLLPATTRGVLELKLVGIGSQATSRLLLTNLSLVAKKWQRPGKPAEQTVQVYALDMESAEPVSDVDIALVRKSGKVVARCTTRGADGCRLAAPGTGDPDDVVPFAVIARKGDDLTYLRYEDLRAEVAGSSTSGAPYVADAPYRAAVYADRGVYRPGDTAHVVAIVRDARDRAPDPAVPVDVQVLDPRAKVIRKLTVRSNPAGVIAIDQAFPVFADTGHWRVALAIADKPVAREDLQVEEFAPERMRVTVAPQKPELRAGDKAVFDISAQYLFGGSALDSGVELTCTVEPAAFAPAERGELSYGIAPRGKPVTLGQRRGQIEPSGHVAIACPDGDQATAFTGTGTLVASAAVLEAGSGRSTVRTATVALHPEAFYIGLGTREPRAAAGKTFTVEGAVVDWTGKLAPQATGQLRVELAHLEADYGYGYDRASGDAQYDRWLRKVPEGRREVQVVGGKFSFEVTPAESEAGFVIRASAGKAVTELVLDGEYPYVYDGDEGEGRVDRTPRPAKPTRLAVALPREIEVGKPVTASIRSPYRGKVLWTVETDHLVAAAWKDAAAGDASWSFTLDAFAPSVYVSAFVIKDPHLESRDAFLPDRAFGIGSAHVAPVHATLAVRLGAPREVRSSSPLAITLDIGKTDEPAFATVAVVDEGILSLTRFASPDPAAALFARRALGVETYETIGWTMLHQPAGASSRTGGGDDEGQGEAAGPLGQARVQPIKSIALFSGLVAIGKDGKATIPFQVPQHRGELRVMAVVATASRVGHADARVTVRDPLVLQVTFPRFVTQNDELAIPVFMTNLSGGPLEATVTLSSELLALPGLAAPSAATPPLAFTGKPTGTVQIASGFAETRVFGVKVQVAAGAARLRVVARARGPSGSFEVKDEVDVPVLSAGPRERAIQTLPLAAGRLDLAATASALRNWAPTSEATTFWMTSNPYGESFDHLSYLVHYPYGCIEQTTSATRPLLYLGELVEHVDRQLRQARIEDMVLAGIDRVFTMQTPAGGFGYWPGASEPLAWATAYATDMLLDARQRGYAVPEDRLKEVLGWIEGRVAQYQRGARTGGGHDDEHAEAYLHYVLARAGKPEKARIAYLIAHAPAAPTGEAAEDLYLLKAALHLAGDRRYDRDLKAVDASPITPQRSNTWSFYSDRRRRGLMLSTFVDLFGKDSAGEPLAARVAAGLTGQPAYAYNTQELVWGVTGLGKWIGTRATGTAGGTLVADGATIAPRATKHTTSDRSWSVVRASEYRQLTLDVPAQAAGLWLVISSEGVRPGKAYKLGGDGLAITRTYRDLAGQVIDPARGQLKLGDVIFVELAIGNPGSSLVQNIAVVDRLPAGFEIENPRLGRSIQPAWVRDDDQWPTEFLNVRDDRLEAFGALAPRSEKKLVYAVRAVTSGTFTIPPVEAEAMYDAALWARDKAGTAVIGGPWTGKTL